MNPNHTIVSHKFPEGTVAGLYKQAVAENHLYDAVRFDAQRFNWNLKEFDVGIITRKLINNTIEILLCLRLRLG